MILDNSLLEKLYREKKTDKDTDKDKGRERKSYYTECIRRRRGGVVMEHDDSYCPYCPVSGNNTQKHTENTQQHTTYTPV